MLLDYINELDWYIEQYSPIEILMESLPSDGRALFIENSTKCYFAKYLRDEIVNRDYSDAMTIEWYLMKFQSTCLENVSKFPLKYGYEDEFSMIIDPRSMWSLAFDVAATFCDYLEVIYRKEAVLP